jgi:hypothetical protein
MKFLRRSTVALFVTGQLVVAGAAIVVAYGALARWEFKRLMPLVIARATRRVTTST